MADLPPLLRSPPFPWIDPAAARVSETRSGAGPSADAARLRTLVEAMREARVGGTFWHPPARVRGERVVRVATRQALHAIVEGWSGAPPVVVAPDANWARSALRRLGWQHLAEPVDPWSLLGPGVALHVAAGDEWGLIGHVAGAELVEHGAASPPTERLGAALLGAVRYRDPFTGEETRPETIIALLADWRRTLDSNRQVAVATGMSWWKRRAIERFLWVPRTRPLQFRRSAAAAVAAASAAGGAVAVWPSRAPVGLTDAAEERGVPLVRVEDGFIRSVGLGADLTEPFSIVVDPLGIYYDPTGPSALEQLLETSAFPPALLARAEALADTIRRLRISKYGIGTDEAVFPPRTSRRRVLVPGQVSDDLSVRRGGGTVAGNLDLIARARASEPDAEIWYRPHPDVDAGHRRGAVADADALRHADKVVRGGSMAALLDVVDGVHVLTSLTGFEALLRGLDVTCHGQPFYAGWGLTRDMAPRLARRTRTLTLAQLVAGTLILYPRYRDAAMGLPCSAEILVQQFTVPQAFRRSAVSRLRSWQGRLRVALAGGRR